MLAFLLCRFLFICSFYIYRFIQHCIILDIYTALRQFFCVKCQLPAFLRFVHKYNKDFFLLNFFFCEEYIRISFSLFNFIKFCATFYYFGEFRFMGKLCKTVQIFILDHFCCIWFCQKQFYLSNIIVSD